MGTHSRNKGAAGERELVGLLRELTGLDVRRRVSQYSQDTDLVGVPGWAVECKRHAQVDRADLRNFWHQAVRQARGVEIPVLFVRRDRDEWRAVWPLAAVLGVPVEGWLDYGMATEGTLAAWAAVFRETDAASVLTPPPGSRVLCGDSPAGNSAPALPLFCSPS
jgi:Holliday junction resolvase